MRNVGHDKRTAVEKGTGQKRRSLLSCTVAAVVEKMHISGQRDIEH